MRTDSDAGLSGATSWLLGPRRCRKRHRPRFTDGAEAASVRTLRASAVAHTPDGTGHLARKWARPDPALDTRTTLLDALREHLHLTGTKKGAITASAAPAR